MYQISDRKTFIKAIQRFLSIKQSGIYDEQTRSLVKKFKIENNMSKDSLVDYFTFERLKNEYKKRTLTEAYEKKSFLKVNEMLAFLIEYYRLGLLLPKGGQYTDRSRSAISALKKVFLVEDEDENLFLQRLEYVYEKILLDKKTTLI